ncbi:MAG: hypothetical protein ACLQVI_10550 [Polyangiaceae bacterium]
MNHSHALPHVSLASFALLACGQLACSSAAPGPASPTGSEVAVSTVSGALNNNSGSGVAFNPKAPERSPLDRAFAALNPVGTAYAATWMCTGDTLTPSFDGAGGDPYSFTPASCSVTWLNGRSASSVWSGPFTLNYGSSCDSTHPFMELQAADCEMTRTSSASGETRTITGPDGNSYAIDHNTNGAGTGWDSSVTPAPSDGGVQVSCGAAGCASSRTLVINGSHLTGTITIGGDSTTIWDHTVSSGEGGLTVTGAGADRLVSGTVIVQHNILKYTSTTTFSNVGYGEPLCCFPTAGSVSTTFQNGANVGKTESIEFSDICGEATLTNANGTSVALTFEHCL